MPHAVLQSLTHQRLHALGEHALDRREIIGMHLAERVGGVDLLRRVTQCGQVRRIIPEPLAVLIDDRDQVCNVIRHKIQ